MKQYWHTIFFSIMALCSSLWARENHSNPFPKISLDQRWASLVSRYDRFPYHAPQITTELDLPAPLQLMVKHNQTELLDELQNTCRTLLFQHAAILDLPVDWFRDYPDNPPAEQLTEVLDTAWNYINITQGIITDLNSFLDWYSGDDWDTRFGSTGWYQKLRQCDQNIRFLFAVYEYYHARLSQGISGNEISSRKQEERHSRLKQSFEMLKQHMANSNQNTQGLRSLQLWYIRLGRVLAENEPAMYQTARQELERILKAPLEPEQQYNFHLESLRYTLAAPAIRLSDLDTVHQNIRLLQDWLKENQYAVVQHENKFLELAVLESLLLQKQRSLTVSDPRARERSYLSDRTYLKPMIDLAQKEPQEFSWIQEIVAARLAASINVLEKTTRQNWEEPLRNAGDFELLSLARYYRNQAPPNFTKAQRVYDIFLQTRPLVHPRMPEVLYDTALCCHQVAQPDPNGHVKPENRPYQVKAVQYANQLAQKFPRWTGKADARTVNAFQALVQSADWACRLASEYPRQYSQLARETLAILVGRIPSDGSEPTGPFAASPAAKEYRYYYARFVFAHNQYDQAAKWFDAVPHDHPHRQMARCFAIRCRYQLSLQEEKNQNNPVPVSRYQPWIEELKTVLREQVSDSVIDQAIPLLIRLYQESNQTDGVLQTLTWALETDDHHTQWIALAMKILQEQRPTVLQLFAEKNNSELTNTLTQMIPTAKMAYQVLHSESTPQNPSWQQQKVAATRNYLELLCMAAVIASDQKENHALPPLPRLVSRADTIIETVKQDPDYVNQVWLVRCRAMLAFVQGQFKQSRQLWHRIRSAMAGKKNDQEEYFWWESRYFSLRCLMQLNRSGEAGHVIEVLLCSHPNETSPWIARLKQLTENTEKEH